MKQTKPRQLRYAQKGSSIVEGVLCLLVLCLILFGLLQIALLYTAQEVTQYAAFRTARSMTVGFDKENVSNEGHARLIPVSGRITVSDDVPGSSSISDWLNEDDGFDSNDSAYQKGYRIRQVMYHYMKGDYPLHCEYWDSLRITQTRKTDQVNGEIVFQDYPLLLPFARAFRSSGGTELQAESQLTNFASVYLEN